MAGILFVGSLVGVCPLRRQAHDQIDVTVADLSDEVIGWRGLGDATRTTGKLAPSKRHRQHARRCTVV